METGRRISDELIEEVLSKVFTKKENITPTLRYNRPYFQPNQPSCISTERTKFNQPDFNYSNFRNTRAYRPGKILGQREGNYCHWCGDLGHIKSNCYKKQAFDSTKGKTITPPRHIKTTKQTPCDSTPYDIEFDIISRKLNLLGGPNIPLEELLQLRTVINTLIYSHPSQKETHPKLY